MSHAQRLTQLEAPMPQDDQIWFERLFSLRVADRERTNLIEKLILAALKSWSDEPILSKLKREKRHSTPTCHLSRFLLGS